MKRVLVSIVFFLSIYSKDIADLKEYRIRQLNECFNTELKEYVPPQSIQQQLDLLFKDRNIKQQLEIVPDPKKYLNQLGFTVIQFKSNEPKDVVVIESNLLPGYVIKFVRIITPKSFHRTKRRGIVGPGLLGDRIKNSAKLRAIINEKDLKYIKVPKKYFYCMDGLALLIAQKADKSKRTIKDLTKEEIQEVLQFAVAAHGIIDFKKENMVISADKIWFIDTERPEIKNWPEMLKSILPKFKKEVNDKYKNKIDDWFDEAAAKEEQSLTETTSFYQRLKNLFS